MAKKSNNKASKMAAKNARRAAEAARKANAKPLSGSTTNTTNKLNIEPIAAGATILLHDNPKQGYAATPMLKDVVRVYTNNLTSKDRLGVPTKAAYNMLLELRESFEAGLRNKYETLTATTGGFASIMGDWETDMTEAGVSQLEQIVSGMLDQAIGDMSLASGVTKKTTVGGVTMMVGPVHAPVAA